MIITFPHMGNIYLAAKAMYDDLGIDYIVPDCNNKEILETGSLHSPEEMCLPFKLVLGNFIQGLERGADTVLITGSCGPCRFGEYCELLMKTLKHLGYNPDIIVIDSYKDIGRDEFLNRLSMAAGGSTTGTGQKIKAFLKAKSVMAHLDKIEDKAHLLAGYEKNRGDCSHILANLKKEALKCRGADEMLDLLKTSDKALDRVETDEERTPLKIAIIGEIFTIIEPFTNLFIEDRLMAYGVSTKRRITPTWWLNDMILRPTRLNSLDIKRSAKNYLPYSVGGHGTECIAEAVIAQREGYDGAIQIFPMGCMPEIITKSILPTIQREKDFPIMTLIVDEMTGEAGYVTRIEAFLDMLNIRKKHLLDA